MKIPTRTQAEQLLQEGGQRNPGPWIDHSLYVARAAAQIAARHPHLDADTAYILGCLHDIGRREGITQLRHILDGYNFLMPLHFDDAARICLTHSFPTQNISEAFGEWDGTPEEHAFVAHYLQQITYTPYDRLLQLCDALALPTGFCALEKRFIHVVMRYGFNEFTLAKWRATYMIQADFEAIIGCSIYSILPGVMENTFQTEFEVGPDYFRIKT
ncbi:MAG: HD domain-containing protein [Ardenticatenaceae bacterium]|nr:HD domain-containing protein [Ardenticatenaceae bacterium]